MNYSIVYSSVTGNTKKLADHIQETLEDHTCCYSGKPDDAALEAPVIFLGFWTWRSSCSPDLREFIAKVRDKQVFIFGSAGAADNEGYYDKVITAVRDQFDPSNTVVGTFICQGKMPEYVRQKYEAGTDKHSRRTKEEKLANFEVALSHPDADDFAHLDNAVKAAFDIR